MNAPRYGLSRVFRDEWDLLTNAEAQLLAADYELALEDDGCTYDEYARRIGRGNLASYVKSLRVGEGR